MATAIIFLVSAICGVCGAGIAIGIALVVWPESKKPQRQAGALETHGTEGCNPSRFPLC